MKRLLLALGLWLGFTALASAQCVSVGGVNTVPVTGVSCQSEPNVLTYGASGVGIVPASSATDIACLTGSATRVIRLQRIRLSGSAGTAVVVPTKIMKNASADSGGTAAVTTALPVPYPVDSSNAAATATTTAYTANPTINDTVPGVLDIGNWPITVTSTLTGVTPSLVFDYTDRNFMQAPTLRGVAQQICVNLNGVSVSSGLLGVSFAWTEAPQ